MQIQLLGLAVVLLFVWLFLRRRGAARKSQEAIAATRPTKVRDTTYHAVSLKFGKDACAAAKSMSGQRFLAAEAPQIPLPGCDARICECRFSHHGDRRSGKDRRTPFGAGSISGATGRFDKERRARSDRRRSADPELY